MLGHLGIKYGLKGTNACITSHSIGKAKISATTTNPTRATRSIARTRPWT